GLLGGGPLGAHGAGQPPALVGVGDRPGGVGRRLGIALGERAGDRPALVVAGDHDLADQPLPALALERAAGAVPRDLHERVDLAAGALDTDEPAVAVVAGDVDRLAAVAGDHAARELRGVRPAQRVG